MLIHPRHMQGDACLTKTGGFSLLEVLVASVLFGVGLAAIISLKLFTLSSSQMASNRYKALMLITDMAERIRSNPVGGILALYNFDGSVGIPNTHCANAQCTSAELAQFDLWRWQDSMRNAVSLQGSSGRIEYHNDGSYTIEVSWLNTEAQQPENKSFSQRIYFFSAEEIALMVPP